MLALPRLYPILALLLASAAVSAADHLTSRPLPETPPEKALAVGDKVTTKPGEQRRVLLPDRSVVYVRQNTTFAVTKDSALNLSAGEVFVETATGKLAPMVTVKTPKRTLQARDSRFVVRASADGTAVVVATGSVKVDGIDGPVKGGQQLSEKQDRPERAGRVSELVSWTRELRMASLVPVSEHAGGTLVARDPDGQEAKLELRRYHVDVHVEDGFARTTIDQTYFNHTQDRLEGTFRFPLPADASLCRLAMYVDGNLMEGGMAEREHARSTYERIVWEKRDPALLEWVDGSTFKMRVFPLEPRQEKRILLSYVQRLPSLDGKASYRFPAGHSLSEVGEWALDVRVKGGADAGWACESHALKARNDGGDLRLTASQKKAKLDRDVTLTLMTSGQKQGEASFATMKQDGADYLLVRYRPELEAPREPQRRDWIVLVETSGDREPLLARTQIELVRSFLSNAGRDDTFVVLAAGTRTKALREKAVRNDLVAVEEVLADLEKVHLVGAFDMAGALEAARPHLEAAKSPHLIHVGSGIPAMGDRAPAKLLERLPKGTRYVGVGVGRRWDRALMRTLAEKTGGYFTQVNPDESVAWRGLELASTLDTPRLLDAAVSDADGKAKFLPFVRLVSQGEEVAAVARLKGAMPKRLRITGRMEGNKPILHELEVKDVREKAGYLPRAWAKLELDRLLAEDALGNKKEIVELSRKAYVMTPFTSLLVLENDDQYTQFSIDRGQKNQWASYPAPAKIPVVYEPLDGEKDVKGIKPSRKTVANTVALRAGTISPAKEPERLFRKSINELRTFGQPARDWAVDRERIDPALLPDGPFGVTLGLQTPRLFASDAIRSSARGGGEIDRRGLSQQNVTYNADRIEEVSVAGGGQPEGTERRIRLGARLEDEARKLSRGDADNDGYFAQSAISNVNGQRLTYNRPAYAANDRLYYDLLAYAPGMNTSAADLLAVLEAEARPDPRDKPGRIDKRARALIDAAREPKWRTFTVPAQGLAPAYKIAFDGAGKYSWERTTAAGLKEKVVCDGKTLYYLYPELGLAARRTSSRHHEDDFAARVPYFVQSAENLARGVDVTLVDANTIAVVPFAPKDAKKRYELRLAFDKGRLSERSLVEMPGSKVLYRERYSAKGEVAVIGADNKTLATLKSELGDGPEPSLKANVKDLVVLDLPYRTPEQVRKTLGIKPDATAASLTFAQATQLLGSYVARNDPNQARNLFDSALANRDQRHLGYYVLLASCGANLDSDNADVLDAHPHEPLAHYLSLHSSPTLRRHASRWAAASNVWGEGILRRLGHGHALTQRWSSGKALGTSPTQRRTERGRALEYVRTYQGTSLAWSLLGLMQSRTAEESDEKERQAAYLELAKAYELFADSYGPLARYEQARCEWRGGDAENSRKRFTELYREARKQDRMLRLDADFREALAQAKPGWAELLRETAKDMLVKKDRASVLLLARQCWQLDDRVASRRLLDQAIDGLAVKGDENRDLYLSAIALLREGGQRDEADRLVKLLLDDAEHAKDADLWRLAGSLAAEREQPGRALSCKEKALALDYASKADTVNVEQVRREYRDLLGSYAELTRSLATLKLPVPAGFRDRVVAAADHWRALDREQTEACRLCADVLRGLGERELAFDYLTTPVGLNPGESSPWLAMASDLVRLGERDLADRAYSSAFEREGSNPQILFDRAENLRKAGRLTAAKVLYKQIADGDWQPRFSSLRQQARWMCDEE